MKDLSVVTVTHQSALYIEEQVFSVVSGALKADIEQIVVDNGSTDRTIEALESLSGLLSKVIKNRDNVGFSAANNQALEHAGGRYLLFLNPDMKVQEGSLERLVDWMDKHPDVGISSCLLVDAIGSPLVASGPRRLPSLLREALWLLRLDFLCGNSRSSAGTERKEAEMVKGAFMLVRRELVQQLGFAFDPRYFLLFEDADLCREAKRLGYKIIFHPDERCVDFNSRSFALKPGRWIYHCYTQSMQRYFRKWEPWYKWIWIALLIPIGSFLRFPFWKRRG